MKARVIGDDLSKWYIAKRQLGWLIMPPVTEDPNWHLRAVLFPTGDEALATFARGGQS